MNSTTAIQTYWPNTTSASLFADHKLWPSQAPAGTALPYATVVMVSEPQTARTTGYGLYSGTYQISCHAVGLAAAMDLAEAVGRAFDGSDLGAEFLHCLASEIRWERGVELGVNGADCWIAYVELEVLLQR